MDASLVKLINQSGFTEKQARVYLALLELGRCGVGQIAQHAELKRPIVYVIVQELMKRGYATQLLGLGTKRYIPTDPRKLLQALQAHLDDFSFMLPLLHGLHERGQKKPFVEFYEGKDGVVSAFQLFGPAKTARYISSYQHLTKHFPIEVSHWVRSAVSGKTKTTTRQIAVDEPEAQAFAQQVIKNKNWQVRYLPKGTSLEMDFSIVDHMVGCVSFNPLYIVVIHSPAIADSLGLIFDLLWMSCKPHKKIIHPHLSR